MIISKARKIFFKYLISGKLKNKPIGVVLNANNSGYIVFNTPFLLPTEIFLPIASIFSSQDYIQDLFNSKTGKRIVKR